VDAVVCRRQALELLARREHTRLELERKLKAQGAPPLVVAEALDGLEKEGLVSAARFAESFVRSRVAKGQGPLRIRRELAARGVSDQDAAAALDAGSYDWRSLARSVRIKKYGSERPKRYTEHARQARFLEYRGFDYDQIRSALDPEGNSD
jgi:regulatory protein